MIGIIFKAVDRILPTVAEKRAALDSIIVPRIRAGMDKIPVTRKEEVELRGKIRYLDRGLPKFSDAQLEQFLRRKQAESFMRHDPIQAFPEHKMGSDCPHPKMYGILFEGISLAEAAAFCTPEEGDPMTAKVRRYTFQFDLLPQAAKDAIAQDVVPEVEWNPAFMRLKNGN